MNLKKMYFYVLVALLSSCENKTATEFSESTSYSHIVSESNILEIPLDRYTKTFSFFTQVYQDSGNTYLVRLNRNANQLQFYNLVDKLLAFKIKFAHTGPDGVGDIRNFYVHNLDSIFILRAHANTVFLTDSSAQVYDAHRIPSRFEDNSFVFLSGFTFSPMFYKNEELCIMSISDFQSCNQKLYQGDQPVMIKYHLKTKKETSMAQFPNSYKGKNWDTDQTIYNCYTYDKSKAQFLFSHAASDFLYIRDLQGNLKDSVLCKSDFIKGDLHYDGDCEDLSHLQERHFMETPSYFAIIYDSFRQVYYRLVLLPGKVNSFPADKGMPNDLISYKIPVIIVLDVNFKKIAEKILPEDTYMPFDYFVGKEGLYMSVNHDNSEFLEEDKLKFRLLKLEKNEE